MGTMANERSPQISALVRASKAKWTRRKWTMRQAYNVLLKVIAEPRSRYMLEQGFREAIAEDPVQFFRDFIQPVAMKELAHDVDPGHGEQKPSLSITVADGQPLFVINNAAPAALSVEEENELEALDEMEYQTARSCELSDDEKRAFDIERTKAAIVKLEREAARVK